jgi:uroporphyrinogen-III decarboxylase
MNNKHWDDLESMIKGTKINHLPTGFIIDSPWIPGWYGISNIDYYASDEHWINANLKAIKSFPETWFLPGFWSEYGMCTEPSAFGARMIWLENNLPHAEKTIYSIEDISRMPDPNVKTDGLLPFVINRLKSSEKEIVKNGSQIRFAVSRGPMNIASFLMGTTEFMMSLALNPKEAQQLIDKITLFICNWIAYQKECFPSIDGIFILDDIIGFVGEDEYNQFVIPSFKKIFNSINAKVKFLHNDAPGLITSKYLNHMDINMFNFSYEHSMGEIRELAGPDVILVGNIPPRDVMAAGTPQQVKDAVNKAMAEIKDHSNIIWSCGGGIPPGVNDNNIRAFLDAVKQHSKKY